MRRLCPRHVARLLSVTLLSCVLASPLTGAAATLANADEQPTAEPQAADTSASKRPATEPAEGASDTEEGADPAVEGSVGPSAVEGEPGSGVPRGTFGTPDPSRLVAPLPRRARSPEAVSYTHLTLPTNREV